MDIPDQGFQGKKPYEGIYTYILGNSKELSGESYLIPAMFWLIAVVIVMMQLLSLLYAYASVKEHFVVRGFGYMRTELLVLVILAVGLMTDLGYGAYAQTDQGDLVSVFPGQILGFYSLFIVLAGVWILAGKMFETWDETARIVKQEREQKELYRKERKKRLYFPGRYSKLYYAILWKDLKSRYLYNTNYVIWDNIGLEKSDKNIPSYQIMAEVLNRLDIHSGTIFNYHQERQQTKNYLADLEILQYDILYGKQYIYDGKPPIEEGHMMMGVKDVTLKNVVPYLEEGYSLYGENFTKQSKVFVNGEKQKSSFLNNTRIVLPETVLENEDVVIVVQMGSSSTVFRTSDEYVYEDGMLTVREGTGTDVTRAWTEQTGDE